MNPYEQAAAVYDREPCARTLAEDLTAHLHSGLVISTDRAFAMARITRREWPVEMALNPWLSDPDGDTWHVWLAAGDMSEMLKFGPSKKWLAFERSNVLRFWRFESLRKWIISPISPLSQATAFTGRVSPR